MKATNCFRRYSSAETSHGSLHCEFLHEVERYILLNSLELHALTLKYQRKEDDSRVLGQLNVSLWVISIMGV